MKYSHVFDQNVPDWLAIHNDKLENYLSQYVIDRHPMEGNAKAIIINGSYGVRKAEVEISPVYVRDWYRSFSNELTQVYKYTLRTSKGTESFDDHVFGYNHYNWEISINVVNGQVMGRNRLILLDLDKIEKGEGVRELKERLDMVYRLVVAHNTNGNVE